VLTGLPDQPFIFVLNIQLPGDPPVSCVFFFAIPAALDRDEEMRKVRGMFNQFIDIPFSAEKGDPVATRLQGDLKDDAFKDTVEHPAISATSAASSAKGPAKSWTRQAMFVPFESSCNMFIQ
jgi:hypothetical protein